MARGWSELLHFGLQVGRTGGKARIRRHSADFLLQFAIERRRARELLKEDWPFGNRDGRMPRIGPDQQVQRPATDIGWDILGAPRAPDGSSLFTRNRRQSRLGPRAPIYRQRRQPLFATAADLAIYAQMMLGRGSFSGERILSSRTTTTAAPASCSSRTSRTKPPGRS